jgi:hypothetical protein
VEAERTGFKKREIETEERDREMGTGRKIQNRFFSKPKLLGIPNNPNFYHSLPFSSRRERIPKYISK